MTMLSVLGILVGLGLSAAVGFRVFLPFLIAGVCGHAGWLHLAPGFEWIASWPALIAFGTATVAEIAAYYIPWFDHVLDLITVPAAAVAGSVLAASTMVDLDPGLKWAIAIIAGGGAAGAIGGLTGALRAVSTGATGGIANPIIATIEAGGAALIAALAVAVPILALVAAVAAVALALALLRRVRRAVAQRLRTADRA